MNPSKRRRERSVSRSRDEGFFAPRKASKQADVISTPEPQHLQSSHHTVADPIETLRAHLTESEGSAPTIISTPSPMTSGEVEKQSESDRSK